MNPAQSSMGERLVGVEGVVKWFDPKKGFGFIVGPQGQDIFAHYSKIEGDGFRVLKDGSRVNYDAERGEKGWNASRVQLLAEADGSAPAPRQRYSRTARQ